ncbi:hypothetical protein [Endozoicomonas sp. ALE010]|uniref:hypothetical protein n=1 Tax=Endozoicomonas sp. ALE010 TaxID=3403081 RepID=UPI003BB4E089
MKRYIKIFMLFALAAISVFLIWMVWELYSEQSPTFNFQNSTIESFNSFSAVDDNNYVIAMQRTRPFLPAATKSIGAAVSKVPSYLKISLGDEGDERNIRLDIGDSLPDAISFKLTFMPWRYTAEFIVSILPEDQSQLTWFLKDKEKRRKVIGCGGWLVDKYHSDVVERFKHINFSEDDPREAYICNPLSYINFERKRIEVELSKK